MGELPDRRETEFNDSVQKLAVATKWFAASSLLLAATGLVTLLAPRLALLALLIFPAVALLMLCFQGPLWRRLFHHQGSYFVLALCSTVVTMALPMVASSLANPEFASWALGSGLLAVLFFLEALRREIFQTEVSLGRWIRLVQFVLPGCLVLGLSTMKPKLLTYFYASIIGATLALVLLSYVCRTWAQLLICDGTAERDRPDPIVSALFLGSLLAFSCFQLVAGLAEATLSVASPEAWRGMMVLVVCFFLSYLCLRIGVLPVIRKARSEASVVLTAVLGFEWFLLLGRELDSSSMVMVSLFFGFLPGCALAVMHLRAKSQAKATDKWKPSD